MTVRMEERSEPLLIRPRRHDIDAPGVVFPGLIAVPPDLDDDALGVVAHEGEGGKLTVNAARGSYSAMGDRDRWAEVDAVKVQPAQDGHEVPHGRVGVLIALVVGVGRDELENPPEDG